MNNILVTGEAGFIGANFIHYVLEENETAKIINLDLLTYAGNTDNLKDISSNKRYAFIHGDIGNQEIVEKIFLEHKIDTVVHFAAESHVDRSIHGPGAFVKTNIQGTFVLLEAARKAWLSDTTNKKFRFHHVSTDEVFGSLKPNEPAFTESTPYDPRSPYSASKAASDHLVRAYFHTYKLPITISNCSNNYGPYQFPEKLIPVIILKCLNDESMPVYGDGKQVRDWLYVTDHCEAIWQVLQNGVLGETYNVGGNCEKTNLEIVEIICKLMDLKFPDSPHQPHKKLMSFVTDRPGHDRRYAMNIDKIASKLNWHPSETFESGIDKTLEWYLTNINWIDKIKTRGNYQAWMTDNYSER